MTSLLQAVLRLGVVTLGILLLFISNFEGWLAFVGLGVILLGALLILKSARDESRRAQHDAEVERFDHVQFKESDNDLRRGPWNE